MSEYERLTSFTHTPNWFGVGKGPTDQELRIASEMLAYGHLYKKLNVTPAQINQSAISKAWNQINDRMEEFEVYDGFDDEEKRSDKIERVMLTFYKKDMSLRDIAEMVVDAHEFEEDWGTGSFNKHYGG